MAQTKVVDFFQSKKQTQEKNPSKRRKLQSTESSLKVFSTTEVPLADDAKSETPIFTADHSIQTSAKTKRKVPLPRRSKSTRTKASVLKKTDGRGQLKLQGAFFKSSESTTGLDVQDGTMEDVERSNMTEEITSHWDEHDGPKTPNRKIRTDDTILTLEVDAPETKRTHRKARRSNGSDYSTVTPKKGEDEKVKEEKTIRGQVLARSFQDKMQESCSIDLDVVETSPSNAQSDKIQTHPSSSKNTVESTMHQAQNENNNAMTAEHLPSDAEIEQFYHLEDPVLISPLPNTPKIESRATKPTAVTSPKLKASMEKCKKLQAGSLEPAAEAAAAKQIRKEKIIRPEDMRERLAKCGKLDTLKSKLAEMNSSLREVKKIQEGKQKSSEVAEESAGPVQATAAVTPPPEKRPAPAYERYEHLAREGPPSLALPSKYQSLLSTFQGTDTVVSMLFNRQETITFSKLQAAVQSITKKNFEQRILGQMKTVYPEAYQFRQEKGLPRAGTKTSGYQLTIEPNLEGLDKNGTILNSDGKPTFSATAMLKRKRIFHNTLVNITKDHHAAFLSKLSPPLQVPSSKITRWHPKFGLSSVPDIEPSELPRPPAVVYQTAKQVLEASRGKLPARVEEAMARVAMKSESSKPPALTEETKPAPSSSNMAKPTSSAYRGIPQSLLDKIRAKEAAKMQASLTRDPKEEKKTAMMGRMPAFIRSLRTYFVTEKKPSLPMLAVVEKLADSYATGISPGEVEAHLQLLQEMYPKWLQVIEIARGKYVKIDKNADISKIIMDIENLVKSRK